MSADFRRRAIVVALTSALPLIFLALSFLVGSALGLISVSSQGLLANNVVPADWSIEQHGRFAVALYTWAALGVLAIIGLGVMVVVCVRIIWNETKPIGADSRLGGYAARFLLIGLGLVAGGYRLWEEYNGPPGPGISLTPIESAGLVRGSFHYATAWTNSAAVLAIALLFAAGAALVRRARLSGHDVAVADRLKLHVRTLVLVGGIATLFGTLTIGALNRVSAAAVTGSQARLGDRMVLAQALANLWADSVSTAPVSPKPATQSAPAIEVNLLRTMWARGVVGKEADEEIVKLLEPEIGRASKGNISDVPKSALDAILSEWDERQRARAAGAIESFAVAFSSFWGGVFAASLAIVLGAVTMSLPSQGTGQKSGVLLAMTSAEQEKGEFSNWTYLLRVLTVLAPLLAPTLAQALQALLKLGGSEG